MLIFFHADVIHLDSPLRESSHYDGAPPSILCKNHTIILFPDITFCNILNQLINFIDFFSIVNYRGLN